MIGLQLKRVVVISPHQMPCGAILLEHSVSLALYLSGFLSFFQLVQAPQRQRNDTGTFLHRRRAQRGLFLQTPVRTDHHSAHRVAWQQGHLLLAQSDPRCWRDSRPSTTGRYLLILLTFSHHSLTHSLTFRQLRKVHCEFGTA